MSTQQILPEELRMFESFFDGQNLNKSNLNSVFFVEEYHMTFGSPNKFDGKKNFPKNCQGAKKYFVAEFWFEYPEEIRLPQNYFVFTHVFQLDVNHLEIEIKDELEKNNLSINSDITSPEKIAIFIENDYDTINHLLFDRGKDNHRLLAKEIVKKINQTVGKGYGLC